MLSRTTIIWYTNLLYSWKNKQQKYTVCISWYRLQTVSVFQPTQRSHGKDGCFLCRSTICSRFFLQISVYNMILQITFGIFVKDVRTIFFRDKRYVWMNPQDMMYSSFSVSNLLIIIFLLSRGRKRNFGFPLIFIIWSAVLKFYIFLKASLLSKGVEGVTWFFQAYFCIFLFCLEFDRL